MNQMIARLLALTACVGAAACSLYVLAYYVWRTAAAHSQAELQNAQLYAYVCIGVLGISLAVGLGLTISLWRAWKKTEQILAGR